MTTIGVIADREAISEAYEQLLVPAFVPHELVGESDIIDGVASGSTEVLVARDKGRVVGVAVGDFSEGVTLLSYLAVRPGSRGRGWGSLVLTAALDRWFGTRGGIIVAEVEDPAHHAAHPDYGDPLRRLDFYRDHGARALGIPFFQPSLGPGLPRVPHMFLLVLRVDPAWLSADATRLIDSGPLVTMMEWYFDGCEGTARPVDPDSRALFAALEEPGGVALRAATASGA